jgi:hypothetical protein
MRDLVFVLLTVAAALLVLFGLIAKSVEGL